MARAEDHIHLANKNDEALRYLLGAYNRFPEWITTLAFYKAVQIVDALCVEKRRHAPSGHPDRLDWLQRVKDLQPLYRHFRVLHSSSCIARYLSDKASKQSYKSFAEFLTPEQVITQLIERRLIPIEQYSISQLSDPLKHLLIQTDRNTLPRAE